MSGLLNADMQTLRGWAEQGWRWWLGELAGLVPRRWREGRHRRLALSLYDPLSGRLDPIGDARPRAPLAVVLPRDLVLTRLIETPALGARDLNKLITLDADRIMPLARGEALLAASARGPAGPGRIQVEVAGLPRARAEMLSLALAHAPRVPAAVLVGAPEPGLAQPVDLLPALRAAGLAGGVERSAAPLWLAVAFLFLINMGLLVWRDTATLDTMSALVDQQAPAVNVAHGIIARMRREDAIAAATVTARRKREPLALLARIDAALPSGTWLQRFTWTGDSVKLAGFHPAKADVSGALRTAGMAVARYGDTSNAAPSPLGEPFEITLKLGKR
ncbi:hypothetical protein [Novosphingobium sp.]|uniref:hypothetical protein n=1 Tax=Novosphingobium sp. TaxID=1874826 RepID=UPI003B52AAD1